MMGPDRIGEHAVHPLANELPMRLDLIDDLAQSFREDGQRRPIVLVGCSAPDVLDGSILSGRHRYEACIKAGIAPRFRAYDGPDDAASLARYIDDEDIKHRHLRTDEIIKARYGFARHIRAAKKHNRNQPALLEVAHDDELARIKTDGIPELVEAVSRNEISTARAAEIAEHEPDVQRRVVEKLKAAQDKPHKAIVAGDQWLPPKADRLACAALCVRCSAHIIEHRHGLRCNRCGPLIQWKGV